MKIIEKHLHLNVPNVPDGALFLDIETTGLKAETTHMYLFGCISREPEGTWLFKQWFLDGPLEERAALNDICNYITNFKILIHYNGDRFDLPYLDYHTKERGIDSPFLTMPSLDIYRHVRPLKKLFHMEAAHQKNFERLIGNYREDKYGGGELIEVYHSYQINNSEKLLHFLLLHNEEDVIGMTGLMQLLDYDVFFDKNSSLITSAPMVKDRSDAELLLSFPLQNTYKYGAIHFLDDIYLSLKDDRLNLKLPVFTGEMKYFYPHARDYYYLPAEDRAIHKSLASYVDPAFRQKATAANCYVKKNGSFIPLLSAGSVPVFKKEYGKDAFAMIDDDMLSDTAFWDEYVHYLFQKIKKG